MNQQVLRNKVYANRVSIPKRVSEALNLTPKIFHDFPFFKFQSLKGFQRLWIHCAKLWSNIRAADVSIPKRVSEALNPIASLLFVQPIKFQSLKGFQRLWILSKIYSVKNYQMVSIPKRVSEALNQWWCRGGSLFDPVSIPKRVSEALNHSQQQPRTEYATCFNP